MKFAFAEASLPKPKFYRDRACFSIAYRAGFSRTSGVFFVEIALYSWLYFLEKRLFDLIKFIVILQTFGVPGVFTLFGNCLRKFCCYDTVK